MCGRATSVRVEEMRESVKICQQALDGMPHGPIKADAPKVVLPDREKMKTQMEALIYHFKIVTEGFAVPAGQVYQAIESPRGEMGYFVVSDGTAKPYRVHMRNPYVRFPAGPGNHVRGALAGRRGRGDRLHRYCAGRNRPVSDEAGLDYPVQVRRHVWESLVSMLRVYAHAASLNGKEYVVTSALRPEAWVKHGDCTAEPLLSRPDTGEGSWRVKQPEREEWGEFRSSRMAL
jgi:hypothetical protein